MSYQLEEKLCLKCMTRKNKVFFNKFANYCLECQEKNSSKKSKSSEKSDQKKLQEYEKMKTLLLNIKKAWIIKSKPELICSVKDILKYLDDKE